MALCICFQRVSRRYIAGWRGSSENPAFFSRCTKESNIDPAEVAKNGGLRDSHGSADSLTLHKRCRCTPAFRASDYLLMRLYGGVAKAPVCNSRLSESQKTEGFKTRRKVILSFGESYHLRMEDSVPDFAQY